jgi:SAM-dependent methyltransferase
VGILEEPLQFIRELPLRRKFTVCELGDQWITHGERRLAREFYEQDLKCGRYVSIDGNGRSGSLALDLNLPLPKYLTYFDLVTDFGTGEHVFNQAQVWKSIHYLVAPGGYIVFDRPTQGYAGNGGHCYYNTHWCLFEDLAQANGYEVLRLERRDTTRGELIRGAFKRPLKKLKFAFPQQGRYKKLLRPIIPEVRSEVSGKHEVRPEAAE